jgi:dipeptidase E
MLKFNLSVAGFLFLLLGANTWALQPRIIYSSTGNIQVNNFETAQAFYDELKGSPRDYFITSDKNFDLDINIWLPAVANPNGRYSYSVFSLAGDKEQELSSFNGQAFEWKESYDTFTRDYYFKTSEAGTKIPLSAGKYKIKIFSKDNRGKYVLAVGAKQAYDLKSVLNLYWQIPFLKITFLKTSVLQFFLTPLGVVGVAVVGALIIFFAILNYIIALITEKVRQTFAKTVLLTSSGMDVKDEIVGLLQKPAYDITVGFISTAAKPLEDIEFVKKDWDLMKDVGFNVEEIDIDGKTEAQVMKALELKDIIFVEGGNTFYLLRSMRKCKFEKVMRKLLKQGKVYIGTSAGSIVAGRTIETAGSLGDKNIVKLRNLKGLNFVPFNVFVHYTHEYAELVSQKIQKSKYPLRVLTDKQAILSQGKNTIILGEGSENVFVKKLSIAKVTLKIFILLIVLFLIFFAVYAYFNGNLNLPK